MRHSICNSFKTCNSNTSIWVLAIAGSQIELPEHNLSKLKYKYGDMIYLAKINPTVYTLKEYSDLFPHRKDAIYTLKSNKIIRIPEGENIHREEHDRLTDCSIEYYGKNNGYKYDSIIFNELKQIIMSDEYYIFSPGYNITNTSILNVKRGFQYKDNQNIKRVEELKKYLQKCNMDFSYFSGDNPFINTSKKAGCSK